MHTQILSMVLRCKQNNENKIFIKIKNIRVQSQKQYSLQKKIYIFPLILSL